MRGGGWERVRGRLVDRWLLDLKDVRVRGPDDYMRRPTWAVQSFDLPGKLSRIQGTLEVIKRRLAAGE